MKRIYKILIILILLIIVAITFIFHTYRFSIVTTGSMEPAIETGEMIIEKRNNSEYKEGDIISFDIGEDYYICHRIIKYNQAGDYYDTQGDNNKIADSFRVTKDNIKGKVIYHSLTLGKIYSEYGTVIMGMIFISISSIIVYLIYRKHNKNNKKNNIGKVKNNEIYFKM